MLGSLQAKEYHRRAEAPERAAVCIRQSTGGSIVTFVGKRILVQYDSGLEVVVDYTSETEMTWEAISGPAEGTKATERIYASEVAPGLFFISWVEKDQGITVSNVVDFQNSRVTEFATFDAPQGRQIAANKGTFTEASDESSESTGESV
jgi:MoaF-like